MDRRRRFHEMRLAAIADKDVPAPVKLAHAPSRVGTIVAHVLPHNVFSSLRGRRVSAADLKKADFIQLVPPYAGRPLGLNDRVNIDGVLVWTGQDSTATYAQVYRTGIVEFVGRVKLNPIINSAAVETMMVALVLSNLRFLEKLGFEPPFAILAALLDALDARLDETLANEPPRIDRSPLRFSEVIAETIPVDDQETARTLRPLFDELANAGGLTKSRNFSEDGSWRLSLED
jgi:hypothetical protein